MTSPSRPDIYYLTARVSYKKSKREIKTETWIVSCFDIPEEIMRYDKKTMSRLNQRFFKKSKAKDRTIIVEEILDKIVLGKSQESLDDKKRPNSSRH